MSNYKLTRCKQNGAFFSISFFVWLNYKKGVINMKKALILGAVIFFSILGRVSVSYAEENQEAVTYSLFDTTRDNHQL
jgi:uncharacterized membrane protein YfcA